MNKLSQIFKTGLVVVIISIFTLLIGELLVRVFLPQNKMVTWIEMHNEGFVMNQSGGTAFQEYGNRKAEYRFNEYRLRGNSVTSSNLNILTIGDSFTFGLLLNEEDTYVNILQRKADTVYPDSIQFLNAAVGGSGLADWALWLDMFGTELDVDYLIYFMNYDDVNRALSKNLFIYDENSPDSLIKSQRWKPKEFTIKLSKKGWYRWLQGNSEIANIIVKVLWKHVFFEDLTHNFNPEKSEVSIPTLDSFEIESNYSTHLANSILNKIEDWCDLNGCEFLIINTGFFENETMSIYDQNFYDWIQKNGEETEGLYFDNNECVQSNTDSSLSELKIPGDSHPNEKGAKIITDCTWEKINPILFH